MPRAFLVQHSSRKSEKTTPDLHDGFCGSLEDAPDMTDTEVTSQRPSIPRERPMRLRESSTSPRDGPRSPRESGFHPSTHSAFARVREASGPPPPLSAVPWLGPLAPSALNPLYKAPDMMAAYRDPRHSITSFWLQRARAMEAFHRDYMAACGLEPPLGLTGLEAARGPAGLEPAHGLGVYPGLPYTLGIPRYTLPGPVHDRQRLLQDRHGLDLQPTSPPTHTITSASPPLNRRASSDLEHPTSPPSLRHSPTSPHSESQRSPVNCPPTPPSVTKPSPGNSAPKSHSFSVERLISKPQGEQFKNRQCEDNDKRQDDLNCFKLNHLKDETARDSLDTEGRRVSVTESRDSPSESRYSYKHEDWYSGSEGDSDCGHERARISDGEGRTRTARLRRHTAGLRERGKYGVTESYVRRWGLEGDKGMDLVKRRRPHSPEGADIRLDSPEGAGNRRDMDDERSMDSVKRRLDSPDGADSRPDMEEERGMDLVKRSRTSSEHAHRIEDPLVERRQSLNHSDTSEGSLAETRISTDNRDSGEENVRSSERPERREHIISGKRNGKHWQMVTPRSHSSDESEVDEDREPRGQEPRVSPSSREVETSIPGGGHRFGHPFFSMPGPFSMPSAAGLISSRGGVIPSPGSLGNTPTGLMLSPGLGPSSPLFPGSLTPGGPVYPGSYPGLGGRRLRDPSKPPPAKRYKCDLCGKAFSRSNTLVTHRRIHTGEKPFKCEVCGRAFRQPGNLTRHRLTHTTVKPYVCPVCKKAFNRASNLHTHMRTHTNFKPFVCPYCGRGFNQKVDMKIHMYSHTGAPPL